MILTRMLSSDNEEGEAGDDSSEDMLQECRAHVAAALVAYAKGIPGNSKSVKPFGLRPARSKKAFLSLPSTTFALTFAAIYQTVRTPPHMLDKWLKTPRNNITDAWPRGMIKRFMTLQRTFAKHRSEVFTAFEEAGGEYMEDEEDTSTAAKAKPAVEFDEDFE